ncbi:hypothetical protein DH2020_032542 [Rehmannia glutinosa]|uniref:Pentatricopeptide repeat-containing protein n=1 Tax=Rehmannia glutinosa TaxID=99300 RepID=A0ABR0VI06_REHGL
MKTGGAHASAGDAALIPVGLGFLQQTHAARMQLLSQSLDVQSLMNQFADWMTSQRWEDMKQLFEFWIRSQDVNGKPNKPDVNLYNHYLRANLMIGASVGELLDLVAKMDDYGILRILHLDLFVLVITSFLNLVLIVMHLLVNVMDKLSVFPCLSDLGTVKGVDSSTRCACMLTKDRTWMLQTGKEDKESLPDDESFDLVIGMLLSTNQIDSALKYIDLTLKSGYMLSMKAFEDCVQRCVSNVRLDTLVSIIERCKKMDQNKSLCPPWRVCQYIADVAMQSDNSALTYYALEFMAKWIARGELSPPLGTAGRTYNSRLLDGSWAVLKRSLRQKKFPNPESYLGKIYAHANLGNLQKAFSTLHEFERDYGNSNQEDEEDLFSPFYSLNPLVMACSMNGFATLDSVYYQLENLSQANPPYKSVAALNCIILGCANIRDLDRAYQTFNAIDATFGLTPNVHSYNALICSFGKLSKIDEAVKVFEHFVGLGVKPNATTYSLLIDAHLIKRDPKAALSVLDEMPELQLKLVEQIFEGYEPSKEMLKKIRRRCIREMDYESDDKVESLARKFNIKLGTEIRRNLLFNLQYTTDYA